MLDPIANRQKSDWQAHHLSVDDQPDGFLWDTLGTHFLFDTATATREGGGFPCYDWVFGERVIGLEPTTFCLGSKHSTN